MCKFATITMVRINEPFLGMNFPEGDQRVNGGLACLKVR